MPMAAYGPKEVYRSKVLYLTTENYP